MLAVLLLVKQGTGLSWLFPFVDGHPPIGWTTAAAYLVLPVLLVISQYLSQKLVSPQSQDPAQQQTQAILKFIPFMIGKRASVQGSGRGVMELSSVLAWLQAISEDYMVWFVQRCTPLRAFGKRGQQAALQYGQCYLLPYQRPNSSGSMRRGEPAFVAANSSFHQRCA